MDFLLGLIIGAVFSPVLIRAGKIGYKYISDRLKKVEEEKNAE